MNFHKRTQAFWQWFTQNEEELFHMVQHPDGEHPERVVEFVQRGTELLAPGVKFNLGGDGEFAFTVDGEAHRFYVNPHIVRGMPPRYFGKWVFYPCLPGGHGHDFSVQVGDAELRLQDVLVRAAFEEGEALFDVVFYHPALTGISEGRALGLFSLMLELALGEGFSKLYVREVQRDVGGAADMVPLAGLEKQMKETLFAAGKPVMDNPSQRFVSYGYGPRESAELRFDVIAGHSCYTDLVAEYYAGGHAIFDACAAYGARAAYLFFPFPQQADANAVLAQRHELETALESRALHGQTAEHHSGLLLGGAAGTQCMYIDLLLYDEEAFLHRAAPLLQSFPYNCYLADFKQGSALTPLFAS